MASVFDYIFNIGGNYTATINGMSTATGEFQAKVDGAQSASGISLDSQMHDLSAVAGVTDETLAQIETFARESAKAFGPSTAAQMGRMTKTGSTSWPPPNGPEA